MSTIKVQIVNGASVSSVVGASNLNETRNPLTFHAFSDTMKARILEQFIKSETKIGISFTSEKPRTGEWHEPLVPDSVFNR